MKSLFALGVLILAAAAQPAGATPMSSSDFDVISVVPRSPSVKPQLMPISAKALNKQLASKAAR